jgi:hypothetical protein
MIKLEPNKPAQNECLRECVGAWHGLVWGLITPTTHVRVRGYITRFAPSQWAHRSRRAVGDVLGSAGALRRIGAKAEAMSAQRHNAKVHGASAPSKGWAVNGLHDLFDRQTAPAGRERI